MAKSETPLWHDKKEFAKYEKEKHLFDRTYNGQPYWFYARFDIFEAACRKWDWGGVTDAPPKHIGMKERLERSLYPFLGTLRRAVQEVFLGKRYKKADLLMMIPGRTRDGDLYRNREMEYFDPPSGITVFKTFILPNYQKIDLNAKERTLAWANVELTIYRAIQKLSIKRSRDVKEAAFLKRLEKDIKKKFGNCRSAERMEWDIRVFEVTRKVYRKNYKKILDTVQPKAIFVDCYYSVQNLILIELAQERGIPVIEAMHGVVKNHQSYFFEDQRGVNVFVPDYFLTFGKWQTQWCKLLPRTREIETGYPYRERMVKKYQDIKCDDKQIVFYPNPLIQFEQFVAEFAKLAKEAGYTVKCKFHPNEMSKWKDYYPNLAKCEDFVPITDPAYNVYQCIYEAKYHIFADTTVIYETAPVPGREMFVLGTVPHMQAQPFVDGNIATLVMTPQELLKEIQKGNTERSIVKPEIWKPHAKENMEMFFRKMAEQNWPYPADFKMD